MLKHDFVHDARFKNRWTLFYIAYNLSEFDFNGIW